MIVLNIFGEMLKKIEFFFLFLFGNGFRIDSGTTCCEGEPKLECCSYGMPHCLRGLLSFREGLSSNCKKTLPEIVFFFLSVSQSNHSI